MAMSTTCHDFGVPTYNLLPKSKVPTSSDQSTVQNPSSKPTLATASHTLEATRNFPLPPPGHRSAVTAPPGLRPPLSLGPASPGLAVRSESARAVGLR